MQNAKVKLKMQMRKHGGTEENSERHRGAIMIWKFSDGTTYQSLFMVTDFQADDIKTITSRIRETFPEAVTLEIEPLQELIVHFFKMKDDPEFHRFDPVIRSRIRRAQELSPALLLQVVEDELNLRFIVTSSFISIASSSSTVETIKIERIAEQLARLFEGRYVRLLNSKLI